MGKFTAEEIQIAKAVDLVDLAVADRDSAEKKRQVLSGSGYWTLVMIFNRSSWLPV